LVEVVGQEIDLLTAATPGGNSASDRVPSDVRSMPNAFCPFFSTRRSAASPQAVQHGVDKIEMQQSGIIAPRTTAGSSTIPRFTMLV